MVYRIIPLSIMLAMLSSFSTTTSAQSYIDVDPFDSSIAAIERGIRSRPDGSNHSVLLALRQLRDPEMRPLFQRMLDSDDPTLKIDALLALAEIDNDKIDPFLLEQFSPRERMIAIVAAIDLDLLDKETIEAVFDSGNLTPVEIVILSAAGSKYGIPVDRERLSPLLDDSDFTTVLSTACLLASDKDDTVELRRAIERYQELSPMNGDAVAAALADLASWHPMPSAIPILQMASLDEEFSRGTRLSANDAALGCACEAGIELWREASRTAPNSGDRMRLGIMALSRGIKMKDWSCLRDDRTYNQLLADAGEALATGEGIQANARKLISTRNPLMMEAALALAEHSSAEDTQAIRIMIIKEALLDANMIPVASRCVTDLANDAPQSLGPVLQELVSSPNHRLSEAAAVGLLNSNNPEAWSAATYFQGHTNRTVRSIAFLVEVLNGKKLDKKQLEELGVIASGGGRVDPSIRAMAAWLWLKKTGGQDRALARIVGEA